MHAGLLAVQSDQPWPVILRDDLTARADSPAYGRYAVGTNLSHLLFGFALGPNADLDALTKRFTTGIGPLWRRCEGDLLEDLRSLAQYTAIARPGLVPLRCWRDQGRDAHARRTGRGNQLAQLCRRITAQL